MNLKVWFLLIALLPGLAHAEWLALKVSKNAVIGTTKLGEQRPYIDPSQPHVWFSVRTSGDVFEFVQSKDYGKTWISLAKVGSLPGFYVDWSKADLLFAKDSMILAPSIDLRFRFYLLSRDGGRSWSRGLKEIKIETEKNEKLKTKAKVDLPSLEYVSGSLIGSVKGQWFAQVNYPGKGLEDPQLITSSDGETWIIRRQINLPRENPLRLAQGFPSWKTDPIEWLQDALTKKRAKTNFPIKHWVYRQTVSCEPNVDFVTLEGWDGKEAEALNGESILLKTLDNGATWQILLQSPRKPHVLSNADWLGSADRCQERSPKYFATAHDIYEDMGGKMVKIYDLKGILKGHSTSKSAEEKDLDWLSFTQLKTSPDFQYLFVEIQRLYVEDRD
jgi:hypothetical protein